MDYDFAVIGGGSAGYAAARTATDLGLKTAVIEGGQDVGGLCILRGCMPSKTLIESANRNLTLRRAAEFGLRASGLEVHGDEIIARKRRLIGEFADYRREQLEQGKFAFLRGRARFLDAHRLELSWPGEAPRQISARAMLIATGSRVHVPASVPGLAESRALTSDEALELAQMPPSLIVLGAGPVALELAHYFAALGVAVTVIQRGPQMLTGVDRDVAEVVAEAFRARGIRVFTGTRITGITRDAAGVRVTFEHGGGAVEVQAAELLNGLGREPAVADLDLAAAGVARAGRQVGTNAHQQTNIPHLFAAGDCCGPHEIVHIAIQQGEIAARNAARVLRGEPASALESADYRLKLFITFPEPQVAMVGLTEEEATQAGIPWRAATFPFNDHGKSLVMGETDGFVKLIADSRTGEIIGGAVVGPHASELIHEIVVAMHFRATAAQLAAIPHYHPTLSEIWTYPAESLSS